MPTWFRLAGFIHDYDKLSDEQRRAFRRAVRHFVADLRVGRFRRGLRVKKLQGHDHIWEMTWAPDGRATFEFGEQQAVGEVHVVWRRIGTHDILDRP